MPSSLAPALLLSMPQLVDPHFSRTVILLCKHGGEGAFGLIVNRPLLTTGRVVVESSAENVEPVVSAERELRVWIGGPVEPQRSWILVKGDPDADAAAGMRITDGLYLSTAPDLLRRLLEPDPSPLSRLIVGYANWGPGQLEKELQDSAWLLSDVDSDLVFCTPPERMWEASIRRLGVDPNALHGSRGVH
jgi:putative transcriptional regulator